MREKGMLESPFNQKLGIRADDREDGTVALSLTTDESHRNEVGIVHGAVAMALLDGAMGRCCARTLDAGSLTATVQISVQFLAPAKGRLEAIARVTRRGRSIAFLEGECRRDDGVLVARAQGTWAIVEKKRA